MDFKNCREKLPGFGDDAEPYMDVPGCGNTRNTSKAIKKRLYKWMGIGENGVGSSKRRHNFHVSFTLEACPQHADPDQRIVGDGA